MPVNDPNNPGPLSSMGQSMFPGSTVHTAEYNVSSQYPTAALNAMTGYEPSTNPLTGEELPNFAGGGIVSLATGGEIADAYRQYLGRDPEAGAYDAWAGADMGSLIAGITGSQEYANRSSGGGGGIADIVSGSYGGGGGSSGGTDINALYQQYLGRNADASGAATYAGWNPDDIRNAILGSQEYANRTSSGGGSSGGGGGSAGGNDINSLYQQYLGRGADASGIATYAGWSPDQIKAAILGSQEYANAHPEAAKAASAQKIQDLANTAFSKYRTNQNYDAELRELDALAATNPAAYYKAKIGWVGNQMGWQAGQGTSAATMPGMTAELKTYLAGAKAAGVTDAEINSIVNTNSALQQKVNAERIASDAKGPQGWVNQNIPGGWTTLAAAAALATAGAGAYGLLGSGAGALGGAAAGTEVTGIIGSDIASMVAAGATEAEIASALMGTYGMSEATALGAMEAVAAGGAGALDAGVAVLGGELYGAGSGGLSLSQILSGAKTGLGALSTGTSIAKMLGLTGNSTGTGTGTGIRYPTSTGTGTGTGTGIGTGTGTGYGTGYGTGTGTGLGINIGSLSLGNTGTTTSTPTVDNVPLFQVSNSSALGGDSPLSGATAGPTSTSAEQIAQAIAAQNAGKSMDIYQPDYMEFAKGGITNLRSGGLGASLGGYSDGGQLLKGPGDGMSDNIPATIGGKQPARLADGEFVIPADVVSHLGNGSTDAGAKHLYKMMNKIRKARTGSSKQGKQINAAKFLPRG